MVESEVLDTYNRALTINLDPSVFGSFAEIGAGQETARWFLRVGAASGTVAKTISAYDKLVSDDLYGGGMRYVSGQRLETMLEVEWNLLKEQIASRQQETRAFVFANTVSARNYAGTNQCHGWLGLRFMPKAAAPFLDIVVHVNLRGKTNLAQQEALGVLGVNLIYAAYFEAATLAQFLSCLGNGLSLDEIEIDFIRAESLFPTVDQKQLLIGLVTNGLSEGVLLPRGNEYGSLVDLLYKRAIVVEPGRFAEREKIHLDMLNAGLRHLAQQHEETENALGMFSLSTATEDGPDAPQLADAELLSRADGLLSAGFDVLVTPHLELYKVSGLLGRYTSREIRFVMGLSVLIRILADSYSELHGRLLEGLARLFSQDVRVYVYPMQLDVLQGRLTEQQTAGWKTTNTDDLLEAHEIQPPPPIGYLYSYLLSTNLIESIGAPKTQTTESFTARNISINGSKRPQPQNRL
jgi:hypothetical protein